MINFAERKKALIQDINTQRTEIARLEAMVKDAQVLLARLEGAALLCDEFIAEQSQAQEPAA